jgi:hypothetical protein
VVRSNDAVLSFLNDHPVDTSRQLVAATVFAECMVQELQAVLEEWEVVVQELQNLKRRREVQAN